MRNAHRYASCLIYYSAVYTAAIICILYPVLFIAAIICMLLLPYIPTFVMFQ